MKVDFSLSGTVPRFERIRQTPKLRIPQETALILFIAVLFELVVLLADFVAQISVGIALAIASVQLDAETGTAVILLLRSVEIAAVLLFCRCIERRAFRTLGLTGKRMLPDYLAGLLLGFAMFSAVLLLILAGGAAVREENAVQPKPLLAGCLAVGWMIQGFSEELTFRGYLMMSLGTRTKPWRAVIYSAVCFALAHLGNSGISLPALVNLTLFGILMSLLVLRTDSIWCAAAVHAVWNWAQGSFYGLQVSGMETGASFFRFALTGSRTWLGGGAFGPEGGAAATLLLAVCITVLLLLPNRSGDGLPHFHQISE